MCNWLLVTRFHLCPSIVQSFPYISPSFHSRPIARTNISIRQAGPSMHGRLTLTRHRSPLHPFTTAQLFLQTTPPIHPYINLYSTVPMFTCIRLVLKSLQSARIFVHFRKVVKAAIPRGDETVKQRISDTAKQRRSDTAKQRSSDTAKQRSTEVAK